MSWWASRQLRSGDRNVRKQAIRKLGASRDIQAVQPLIKALKDEDEDIRRLAAVALGKINKGNAVPPLLAILKSEEENNDVREAAKQSILAIGSEAVKPLTAALKNKDKNTKLAAIRLLDEIGDPEAIQPLIEALDDKDPDARMLIVTVLGGFGTENAIASLIEVLMDFSESDDVKEAAKQSILMIGFEAVQPLVLMLSDSQQSMRELAGKLLLELGASDLMIEALVEIISSVRFTADARKALVAMLVESGSAAVQALINVVNDHSRDADELTFIVEALSKIGDVAAFKPLVLLAHYIEKDSPFHENVTQALDTIGSANVQFLIELLKSGGEHNEPMDEVLVRSEAARILGGIGGEASTQVLNEALDDEAGMVRYTAIDALETVGDSSIIGINTGRKVQAKSLDEWQAEIQHIRDAQEKVRYDLHQKKRQLEEKQIEYSDILVDIALGAPYSDERIKLLGELSILETEISDLEITMKGLQKRERICLNAIRNPDFVKE